MVERCREARLPEEALPESSDPPRAPARSASGPPAAPATGRSRGRPRPFRRGRSGLDPVAAEQNTGPHGDRHAALSPIDQLKRVRVSAGASPPGRAPRRTKTVGAGADRPAHSGASEPLLAPSLREAHDQGTRPLAQPPSHRGDRRRRGPARRLSRPSAGRSGRRRPAAGSRRDPVAARSATPTRRSGTPVARASHAPSSSAAQSCPAAPNGTTTGPAPAGPDRLDSRSATSQGARSSTMAAAPPSAACRRPSTRGRRPPGQRAGTTSSPTAGEENAAVRVANPSAISSSRASDSAPRPRGGPPRPRWPRRSAPVRDCRASGFARPRSASSASAFGWGKEQRALGRWSGLRGSHSPGIVRRRRDRVLLEDGRARAASATRPARGPAPRQLLPGLTVRLERLGLTPRSVERQHELDRSRSRSGWRATSVSSSADELGVAAEREVGVDTLLERAEPQLLEPRDLGLGERLVGEVGERRPAPQRERLAELLRAALGGAPPASATSCSKRARSSSAGRPAGRSRARG